MQKQQKQKQKHKQQKAAETTTTKRQNAKRKHVAKNFGPCVGGTHIFVHSMYVCVPFVCQSYAFPEALSPT